MKRNPGRQEVAELVELLAVETHWSLIPAFPLRRLRWIFLAVLLMAFQVAYHVLSENARAEPAQAGGLVLVVGLYIGYLMYCLLWPLLLKRILRLKWAL